MRYGKNSDIKYEIFRATDGFTIINRNNTMINVLVGTLQGVRSFHLMPNQAPTFAGDFIDVRLWQKMLMPEDEICGQYNTAKRFITEMER